MNVPPLRRPDVVTQLADGRDIMFFDLPGTATRPVTDQRPLPPPTAGSQIRLDRQTGDWVAVAALRQDRTYKPPADQCPLCPSPDGTRSEVPASGYDVVVFENRFPSLSGARPGVDFTLPAATTEHPTAAAGHGRCEVICFDDDHTASLASLPFEHARLVVDAWRSRTDDLLRRPGVQEVFCFENRGEEIGVTLTHPHGQIYAYPYLTPRTAGMLRTATVHRDRFGDNLFERILNDEVDDGSRIVVADEHTVAFVPFAARWPLEVHIHPRRRVRTLVELSDAELDSFTATYLDVLRRCDRLYPTPLPYIGAVHQFSDAPEQREGALHIELMSVRRSATKLKYLAGSESAMDAFITDVTPESVAARLRDAGNGSAR